MWRQIQAVWHAERAIFALACFCIGFQVIRLMFVGVPVGGRSFLFAASLVSMAGPALVVWAARLILMNLARRIADELPLGPKHWVELFVRRKGRALGSDFGILRLDGGCLRFDGLQTCFAVPRDDVFRTGDGVTLGVDVREERIELVFGEVKRLQPDAYDLPRALREFEAGPSAGVFVPPPTTVSNEAIMRIKRLLPAACFWAVVMAMAVIQANSLSSQGLLAAHRLLVCTFTSTLVVATLGPVWRIYRLLCSPVHSLTGRRQPAIEGDVLG